MSRFIVTGVSSLPRSWKRLVREGGPGRGARAGQALFLPNTHPWPIDYALKQTLPLRDIEIEEPMGALRGGTNTKALTYIHNVKNGRDSYFFR